MVEKAKQNRAEIVAIPDRGVGVVKEGPDAEGRLEGTVGGRCLGNCGAGSCNSCGSLGSCCLSSRGCLEVLLDLSLDLLGRCLTVDAAGNQPRSLTQFYFVGLSQSRISVRKWV